jgi:hypothetical protein
MRQIKWAAVAAVAFVALHSHAEACSILPPTPPPALVPFPGEGEESYSARLKLHMDGFYALRAQEERGETQRNQAALWETSAAVAVVEATSAAREIPIPNGMGNGAQVDLRVVGWLKGKASPKTLRMAQTFATSCGPSPSWDVFQAKQGQRFVVFFATGKADQDNARGTVLASQVVEPALIAALAARVK